MMIEAFGYVWLQRGLREWKIGKKNGEGNVIFCNLVGVKKERRKQNGKSFPTEPTIFFLYKLRRKCERK